MELKIISMDSQAFFELLNQAVAELEEKFGKEEPWVDEATCMSILNIRSRTTLQKLRDTSSIRFSQPTRKHIVYFRQSLYDYLENHANRPASPSKSDRHGY